MSAIEQFRRYMLIQDIDSRTIVEDVLFVQFLQFVDDPFSVRAIVLMSLS